MLPPKLVACELAPNYRAHDVFGWIFRSSQIEDSISQYVDLGACNYWVDSGRTGLALVLQSLGLEGNEVLLQAFSCVVVPNSVLQAQMKPVVVDIEEDSFNISLKDAEQKITENTRVLIVQHTFGYPADMHEIMKFVQKYGLILIEDMAHALGNTYDDKLLGSYGDYAVYSFGRDKVISCGTGGLIVQNNNEVNNKLERLVEELPAMSWWKVFQQFYYLFVVTFIVKPLYHWNIGKLELLVSQKIGLINGVFTRKEVRTTSHLESPSTLHPFLKKVLGVQVDNLPQVIDHRKKLSSIYSRSNVDTSLIRYPLVSSYSQELQKELRKIGVIVGRWYGVLFIPKKDIINTLGYEHAEFPNAMKVIEEGIINLPTNINTTEKDAHRIKVVVDKYLN